jgi:hypothetical protein
MKLCNGCGETKPLDAFYRNRRGKIIARCKPCHRRANRSYEQSGRRDRSRSRRRWRERLREYGLTVDDFDRMLVEQVGRCGACSAPLVKVNVDHCHQTGAVRGLLCGGCNSAAGMAGDDPARLRQIAAYLEGSASP